MMSGPCHRCGQQGHFARNCQNSSQETYAPAQQGPDEIQVVTDRNSKRDVYLPVKLLDRRTVALIDTGCDTWILGSRMIPKHVQLQTSATHLRAANGTQIQLLGELEVKFLVAGRQYSVVVAVTEAVDEFILGIDFLSAEACQWDFGGGRILLGSSWVRLHKQDSGNQVRSIYVAEDYHVPPGVQADVPVSVRPKFHLFRLDTTRHVRLRRASRDERVEPCCSNMADDEQAIVLSRAGPSSGPSQNARCGVDSVHTNDQESNDVCAHVQCLVDNLPSKLTD